MLGEQREAGRAEVATAAMAAVAAKTTRRPRKAAGVAAEVAAEGVLEAATRPRWAEGAARRWQPRWELLPPLRWVVLGRLDRCQ